MRTAIRALRGSPSFSAVVVLIMAVAIGAGTAIFSVYDRLVAHPVDIPHLDSLVAIWSNNTARGVQAPSISVPRFDELRRSTRGFSSLGLSSFDSFTLTGNGEATQLNGLRVSAGFLPTLGILPARGRNFSDAEDAPNGPAVCILSYELWQMRFGGRDSIVGDVIQLNGAGWQVIGIMPPHLTRPFQQVQVLAPRVFETGGLTSAQIQAGAGFAQPIARVRAGVSAADVRDELAAFSRGYAERHAGQLDATNVNDARPFINSLVTGFQPTVYTLLAAVACVILIACANVASLLLSRLLRRRKDIAIRLSLGATRRNVIAQCLSESLVFSATAAALGIGLAALAVHALQSIASSQLPAGVTLALNWRALIFAVAAAGMTAVLTGLLPALQASRPDLVEHLKDSTRGSSSAHGGRPRQALIVGEVALSVVLLVGAALLLVSFDRLQRASAGFDSSGSASAFVGVPPGRYPTPAQQADFFDRVVSSLRAQPGVTDAAAALTMPMTGFVRTPYGVAGRPLESLAQRPLVHMNIVTDGYFRLMRIPVRQGRGLTRDDRATAPAVCVVNETFARHLFPDRSPIGEVLLLGGNNRRVEIVGVIGDVKSTGVNQPTPDEAYFPLPQLGRPGLTVIARTNGDPAMLQAALRAAVAGIDPGQAISFFTTTQATVASSLGTQQLVAALTSVFAAMALLLSLTGLYSVLAHLVSQRTPEIGIRMALGATRRQVVTMMLGSGLALVAAGLVIGIAGAAAAARLLQQLLFGVSALDVTVYAAVAFMFAIVAVLACLGPSLRASRIDPLAALRSDG
jgi:predicted permease